MGDWDDDDWDAEEALNKKLEDDKKKKDDWDDESSEEEKKPEPKPEAKPKPKAKKKEAKKKPEKLEYDVPLDDPVAEKMRRQKLVEEADQRLLGDLFDDCKPDAAPKGGAAASKAAESSKAAASTGPPKVQYVTVDTFEQLELKTQKDIEALSARCAKKINDAATLKAGAAHKFVYDLVKAMTEDFSKEELNALDTTVAAMLKEKKVAKAEVDANKRKNNEKMNKNTKFNAQDEMSIMYGDGDWDEYGDDYYEDY